MSTNHFNQSLSTTLCCTVYICQFLNHSLPFLLLFIIYHSRYLSQFTILSIYHCLPLSLPVTPTTLSTCHSYHSLYLSVLPLFLPVTPTTLSTCHSYHSLYLSFLPLFLPVTPTTLSSCHSYHPLYLSLLPLALPVAPIPPTCDLLRPWFPPLPRQSLQPE